MCLMCEPYRIKCQNLSHFNVHSSKHLNPHSSMHLNTCKRVFQLFNIVVDNLMHYVKVCCSFFLNKVEFDGIQSNTYSANSNIKYN